MTYRRVLFTIGLLDVSSITLLYRIPYNNEKPCVGFLLDTESGFLGILVYDKLADLKMPRYFHVIFCIYTCGIMQ